MLMTDQTQNAIQLTINGKPVRLPKPMTITEYLELRRHHERLVVVELNGVIIKKDAFSTTLLRTGDKVEIVHFVGGG